MFSFSFFLAHGFGATLSDSLYFEPNLGQSRDPVRYVARARGAVALILDDGIMLRNAAATVRLTWEDPSPGSRLQSLEPAPGVTSYLTGRDSSHWLHNIPHFSRVTRKNLYPGIDLILYGSLGRLEFDFCRRSGFGPYPHPFPPQRTSGAYRRPIG